MSVNSNEWIVPDWPAPPNVRSLMTTRHGGVSKGVYASLNLGTHVGDDPENVAENRRRLVINLPDEPLWLSQVHGTRVAEANMVWAGGLSPQADGAVARAAHRVCAVMTADCLPVLLCDRAGSVVAAAHAGWRGLNAGILEQTVAAMSLPAAQLLAYLGPAIGPDAFEVGDEVRAAFVESNAQANEAFKPLQPGKWLANIYLLAQQRLTRLGVNKIYGGDYCTVGDKTRFFSYRRDGVCGRMASLIWLVGE